MFVKVLARLEVIPTGEVKPDAEAEPRANFIVLCWTLNATLKLKSFQAVMGTARRYSAAEERAAAHYHQSESFANMAAGKRSEISAMQNGILSSTHL